jgi:2-polyprenyl-6-methoxyphenol hydroxylase-like FAD-dependent oxidoreductase
MDTDILIVGAGPTGLMLANQLGRRGIRAMIIDRHSGPAQQTRAMAVHARTLEIYSKLGIAERALELGQRGNGANMWTNGKWAARVPLQEMGAGLSPFPFVLMLGQDENERIMGSKLRDWGMTVQWNTELIGLEQHAADVRVTLKQPDGTRREISAAYVAGCDGARSSVRQLCDIGFPGAPYEHVFFVADTEVTGPMVPSELNVYLWKDGFHLFFPMRGTDRWRVIGILPKELRRADHPTFEQVSPAITKEAGAGLAFKSCSWFSTYRIHHRCVERFRDRRCFLLGDAAHVHSPMGGQGMNTGLQDAYNLAWKLALVARGQADERLLDTYEAERLPVAHQLLRSTDRAFTMVVSDSWRAGLFRTRVLTKIVAFAMKRARARARAFRLLSQIGIRYARSPLSQALGQLPEGAPHPGERFPWMQLKFEGNDASEDVFQKLDDTRFNLVVIGQAVPAGIATTLGQMRTHVINASANESELARARVPSPSFYLVRPDGYIGLAGTRLESGVVSRYLSAIGIGAAAPTAAAA